MDSEGAIEPLRRRCCVSGGYPFWDFYSSASTVAHCGQLYCIAAAHCACGHWAQVCDFNCESLCTIRELNCWSEKTVPQDSPRWAQDGPRSPQDGPTSPQEAPKMTQEPPQGPPRRANMAPSLPTKAPRRPKMLSRRAQRPQDAPKEPPRGLQEAKLIDFTVVVDRSPQLAGIDSHYRSG